MIGFIIFLIFAFILFLGSIRIVTETQALVIERLGKFNRIHYKGLHLMIPVIERGIIVELKEQICDYPPQPVITKDNVTMRIDSVVFYKVFDPKLYCYSIQNPKFAIETLCATTLRNLIGELDLDETLTSRDVINSKLTKSLDEATDPWGIKVLRVEVKNILPPKDIQDAMEKQMRAERERREQILKAEGDKKAAVLEAEGFKESTILKAEAQREALIAEATGKAEALKRMYNAQAEGIECINRSKPSKEYITLEGYKALEKMSDGQSTKIIVPNELAGLAGSLTALSEVVKEKK